MNLKNKIEAGIFGVAVGDALGVPVEFCSRKSLDDNPVKGMREYGTHRQPRGTWSDDSSLTFCLMESICTGYDPEDIGLRFLQWKNEAYWTAHGNVFDIGLATRQAITEYSKGTKPELCGGFDEYSNGNGSLMRILPMAFYLLNEPSIEERYKKIKVVSAITHAHIRSVIGCFIYVEYVIKLIKGEDRVEALFAMQNEVAQYLNEIEINPAEINLYSRVLTGNPGELKREEISSSGYVLHSLEASFWAFLSTDNFKDAVLKAVNLGEDTDTVGAIAGGLAGTFYGFDNQFDFWRAQLVRFEDIQNLCQRFGDAIIENNKRTKMKITLLKGDITKIEVDAIVNAANSSLLGGGGVDGAIHRAAGPELLEECIAIRNKQGGCKTGRAVITTAGNLLAKFVIHTVGPVWNGGRKEERELLGLCYTNSLELAVKNGVKSIAFPNISTGIYKFPKADACKIAINAVENFKNRSVINEVKFICFDDENYQLYQRALQINRKK